MKATTVNGDTGRRETSPVASAPATVHFVLQGKGGVGKSFVASILGQYFQVRGRDVRCFDTDPVNQTFAQYRELGVERLDLLADGSIDQRAFDGLVERLLTEDECFVVDNGASTFIPMWNYILETGAVVQAQPLPWTAGLKNRKRDMSFEQPCVIASPCKVNAYPYSRTLRRTDDYVQVSKDVDQCWRSVATRPSVMSSG
jgi:hypothetical protein